MSATVLRLRAVREANAGRLPAGWVDEAAAACGVGRSTMLRYLAQGAPVGRGTELPWSWGPTARAAYYRAAGNVTLARRMLEREEGPASLASLSTMYRAAARDFAPDEQAMARLGERAARGKRLVCAIENVHRNEVWLSDHKLLDVFVVLPRGKTPVRPWMTVLIDGYSRRAVGASLSVTPNRGHVLSALAMAIGQCGIPEMLVFAPRHPERRAMLTTVFDEIDDPAHVRWLNARHVPELGIVVLHLPPSCSVRLLATEILLALGRSVPEKVPHLRDRGHQWAHAWLVTALPRCDLVIYGAQRLTEPARAWLEEVARSPRTNVWLVTLERPEPDDRNANWHWNTFQTHPWPERSRSDELAGSPAPWEWRCDDLPPFPLSHVRAHNLSPDSWEGINRLGMTYASVRRYELARLLSGERPPAIRNVSAALARLTMISLDRPDLTVLCRYLEHDVFLHGAVLTIDIDSVLEIVGPDHDDHAALRMPRGQGACNPAEAARDVVGTLNEFGRLPFMGACDIAVDGTHAIELDGDRREIPPWARWPLRAACWLDDATSTQPRETKRRASSNRLYGHLPPAPDDIAHNLRVGLEPLTSTLQDAFSYQPYVAGETAEPSDRADGFSVHAARAIWTLQQHRRTQDRPPRTTDPGVQWLIDNDLAYECQDDGRPALRAWLTDAIKNDAFSRGPKFNEDYRIRFSNNVGQPTSARYARHLKEPQRYFRTLTR